MDESVLARRGIIRNPAGADDILWSTIWVVEDVERTEDRFYFLFVPLTVQYHPQQLQFVLLSEYGNNAHGWPCIIPLCY